MQWETYSHQGFVVSVLCPKNMRMSSIVMVTVGIIVSDVVE